MAETKQGPDSAAVSASLFPEPVALTRLQIGRDRMWTGAILDTTVKSGIGLGRVLAPTWALVMGHKRAELTDTQYVRGYAELLLPKLTRSYLEALAEYAGPARRLCLLCYCNDSAPVCHTHCIIAHLASAYPLMFRDARGYGKSCDGLMLNAAHDIGTRPAVAACRSADGR